MKRCPRRDGDIFLLSSEKLPPPTTPRTSLVPHLPVAGRAERRLAVMSQSQGTRGCWGQRGFTGPPRHGGRREEVCWRSLPWSFPLHDAMLSTMPIGLAGVVLPHMCLLLGIGQLGHVLLMGVLEVERACPSWCLVSYLLSFHWLKQVTWWSLKLRGREVHFTQEVMAKKAGELGLIFCSVTSRFHYCTHFTNEETGTE